LIERLQARLGVGQVQRLRPVEDHRPERATDVEAARAVSVKESSAKPPMVHGPQRPVWLLPTPEPLPERQLRPLLDGKPLQLMCGPERIEAGWWDNALAERDYFIALAGDGALVWIYRARLPMAVADDAQGWFLQGRFG
jgi:protein ImuB